MPRSPTLPKSQSRSPICNAITRESVVSHAVSNVAGHPVHVGVACALQRYMVFALWRYCVLVCVCIGGVLRGCPATYLVRQLRAVRVSHRHFMMSTVASTSTRAQEGGLYWQGPSGHEALSLASRTAMRFQPQSNTWARPSSCTPAQPRGGSKADFFEWVA